MAFLRGSKKLWLAAGLTSCGAVILSGYNGNRKGLKASAANLFQTQFNDNLKGDSFKSAKWDYNWDKREPYCLVKPINGSVSEKDQNEYNEKLGKAKAVATRHLILVRHGQYDMSGKSDKYRVLTPLGKEQANHMKRATETASIISKYLPDLPVDSCDFIREGSPIPPDPPSKNWRPNAMFYEDGARIEAAFRKYFHRADSDQKEDSYEIIVCHANVIRYFLCRALQFPPEGWLRFWPHNCSLTWIEITPSGKVFAYTVGDVGHIPPSKMTTS